MLEVRNLSVHYGALCVADGISFSVQAGDWLMIAGPNGAGKSTVLGAVAQGVPYTGSVFLNGQDARRMKPRARARLMGTLNQRQAVNYAFTVEEIVRMGRYAYSSAFLGHSEADERAVREALAFTGMESYRKHSALTLSGGELQRAFLAQVFAQEPGLLLLDEPTNHLDLKYQKQIFDLIRGWLAKPGRAAVTVVHDLSLARKYGTRALLLDHGRVIAAGNAAATLSGENLRSAYGMDVESWMRALLSQWE